MTCKWLLYICKIQCANMSYNLIGKESGLDPENIGSNPVNSFSTY